MKKFSYVPIILLLVAACETLSPSISTATPQVKSKDEIDVFIGRWFATRLAHGRGIEERLNIQCNKEICSVELIADWSNSCSTTHNEVIGAMLKGSGPVEVEWPKFTISVDAYCLTKPPTYSRSADIWFEYIEADNALLDNIDTIWHR